MILHTNNYIRTIMKKNLLSLGGSTFAAFLFIFSFSSCHDEEVDNTSELAYRHAYEDNFVKLFGEVDPNKSWDFSTFEYRNIPTTRAGSYTTIKNAGPNNEYYQVPTEVMDAISTEFPEHGIGTDYRLKPFMLQTSYSPQTFDIAYIYQGFNEPAWDLYYVIQEGANPANSPVKLFSKGDVLVDKQGNGNYQPVGQASRDAGTIYQTAGANTQTKDDDEFEYYSNVWAPVVTIEVPALSTIYFYLKITKESVTHGNGSRPRFAILDDVIQSIDYKENEDGSVYAPIGLIDIPTPSNVPSGNETYVLACEDYCVIHESQLSAGQGRSVDFNDMVFMISGNIPSEADPQDLKLQYTKRYFIEDLYGYDYDFNDIVVDVSQNQFYRWIDTDSDGHLDELVHLSTTQSAMIQHQCGTLPYQLKIGDTYFGQVTDPTNEDLSRTQLAREADVTGGDLTTVVSKDYQGVNPGFEKSVSGWDPDQNNITAWIWTKGTDPTTPADGGSSSGVWASTFPTEGEVPYIIAVDHDQEWTAERQIISEKIPSFNTEGWLPNK